MPKYQEDKYKDLGIKCNCGCTIYVHLHDTAYEIDGTHISGSERFECKNCEKTYHSNEGIPMGFKFILDGV